MEINGRFPDYFKSWRIPGKTQEEAINFFKKAALPVSRYGPQVIHEIKTEQEFTLYYDSFVWNFKIIAI